MRSRKTTFPPTPLMTDQGPVVTPECTPESYNRLVSNVKHFFRKKRESNLVAHARHELALLDSGNDEYQKAMNKHLLEMVKLFSEEGHSGFSASYAINMLQRLLRFEPLTPLTGEKDEWCEVGNGVFQNKRCGRIFWEPSVNPQAYDIDGRVFEDRSGHRYTNKDSRRYIDFPYTPVTEYIKV